MNEDTLATMAEDAYVNHIPVLTGGSGRDELREFYSKRFIPQMPPDTVMTPVSRTIGEDQIVDEMVFKFTHTIPMDWMLPGIPPTRKRVEIPLVAIVRVRNGKLAHEHIYWDQASVLKQIGLLSDIQLPVVGVETERKVADPQFVLNRASGSNPCVICWGQLTLFAKLRIQAHFCARQDLYFTLPVSVTRDFHNYLVCSRVQSQNCRRRTHEGAIQ